MRQRSDAGKGSRPYAQGGRQVAADVRWRQHQEHAERSAALSELIGASGHLGPDASGQLLPALEPLYS
jgi:hypothetical protein